MFGFLVQGWRDALTACEKGVIMIVVYPSVVDFASAVSIAVLVLVLVLLLVLHRLSSKNCRRHMRTKILNIRDNTSPNRQEATQTHDCCNVGPWDLNHE